MVERCSGPTFNFKPSDIWEITKWIQQTLQSDNWQYGPTKIYVYKGQETEKPQIE